ncbi:acyl carrier protein [Candidatus Daviesbacteria bacterium]|nr:acyl carrier protein [Candidatus Daviesbacteria bacterium]
MDEKEILQAITEHLGLSVEDIDRNALLREDLSLGPIELNDLLNNLSQKFKITFDPSDVDGLKKVEDIIVLVEDNLLE